MESSSRPKTVRFSSEAPTQLSAPSYSVGSQGSISTMLTASVTRSSTASTWRERARAHFFDAMAQPWTILALIVMLLIVTVISVYTLVANTSHAAAMAKLEADQRDVTVRMTELHGAVGAMLAHRDAIERDTHARRLGAARISKCTEFSPRIPRARRLSDPLLQSDAQPAYNETRRIVEPSSITAVGSSNPTRRAVDHQRTAPSRQGDVQVRSSPKDREGGRAQDALGFQSVAPSAAAAAAAEVEVEPTRAAVAAIEDDAAAAAAAAPPPPTTSHDELDDAAATAAAAPPPTTSHDELDDAAYFDAAVSPDVSALAENLATIVLE